MKNFMAILILLVTSNLISYTKKAFYNFPQDLLKKEINRTEWNNAFRQILDLVKKTPDKSLEKLSIALMILNEDLFEAIKYKKTLSGDKTLNEKLNALSKYMKNGDDFITTKNKRSAEEETELEQIKKLIEAGLSQNEILLKTKDIIKTRITSPIWIENSNAAQVLYNLYNRINDLIARYANSLLRQGQQK